MKKINEHNENCAASAEVRKGKMKSVWMRPELIEEKIIFVCADATCEAKLEVLDINSIRLPKF